MFQKLVALKRLDTISASSKVTMGDYSLRVKGEDYRTDLTTISLVCFVLLVSLALQKEFSFSSGEYNGNARRKAVAFDPCAGGSGLQPSSIFSNQNTIKKCQ